jgi:predicted RecB family nuclease
MSKTKDNAFFIEKQQQQQQQQQQQKQTTKGICYLDSVIYHYLPNDEDFIDMSLYHSVKRIQIVFCKRRIL